MSTFWHRTRQSNGFTSTVSQGHFLGAHVCHLRTMEDESDYISIIFAINALSSADCEFGCSLVICLFSWGGSSSDFSSVPENS